MSVGSNEDDYRTPRCNASASEGACRSRGISLKRFFIEALEEQLMRGTAATHFGNGQRPWMATFGELSDLGDEHRRILGIIEEEFGKLETEDLA